MAAVEKVSDPANQPNPAETSTARRPAVPGQARTQSSPARSGTSVSADRATTGVSETDVSLLVVAPVLTVCRYLADIANIARGLPGVRSVHAGAEHTLTIGYAGAAGRLARLARLAPGRFRIDQQRQEIEWEIRGSAVYSGTLSVHGDCTISQLESTLSSDQTSLSAAARDIHLQMLRRIARAVEAGIDRLRSPLATDDLPALSPAVPPSSITPGLPPERQSRPSGTTLGSHGLVREYWAG